MIENQAPRPIDASGKVNGVPEESTSSATTLTGSMGHECQVDIEKSLEESGEVVAEDQLASATSVESTLPNARADGLQDQTNLLPTRQVIIVFLGLSSALFCAMLNQTIVSTVLPTLSSACDSDGNLVSWVGTAYLLTSTAFQPLYGRASDIFGRKIILMASLLIFLIGGIACGVSQSMVELIVFRALSGIGAGGIVTTVSIVISDVVSLQERGKYQGITGVVISAANALGPVIGGLFAEKASWRWCFYLNAPLSAISGVVVFFALPLKKVTGDVRTKLRQIDYAGCVCSTAASVLILLPISWGGTKYSWTSVPVLAPLIIGVALIPVFVVNELKAARYPVIPMHMFKNPHVATCVFTSFLTGFATFVKLYYLPQFYQVVRGDSPLTSGTLILPLIVFQVVTSFTSGWLVSRYSCYRWNLIIGYAIWTIASGLFITYTSNAKLIGYQNLTGLGSGQTLQITLVALQAAVPRHEMAVITSARNFLRMVGSTLAIAATAAMLNNVVRTILSDEGFTPSSVSSIVSDPTTIKSMGLSSDQVNSAITAYTTGVKRIYIMMTVLAGAQLCLCALFVRDYSLKRADDEALKAEAKRRIKEKRSKQLQAPGGSAA